MAISHNDTVPFLHHVLGLKRSEYWTRKEEAEGNIPQSAPSPTVDNSTSLEAVTHNGPRFVVTCR